MQLKIKPDLQKENQAPKGMQRKGWHIKGSCSYARSSLGYHGISAYSSKFINYSTRLILFLTCYNPSSSYFGEEEGEEDEKGEEPKIYLTARD